MPLQRRKHDPSACVPMSDALLNQPAILRQILLPLGLAMQETSKIARYACRRRGAPRAPNPHLPPLLRSSDIAHDRPDFAEPGEGAPIERMVSRRLDLASGRYAVIESAHEFALVP